MKTPVITGRRSGPKPASRDGGVCALIDELLAHAAGSGEPRPDPGPVAGVRQVVLEADMHGVRYLLVRVTPLPARAVRVTLSPREREVARLVAKGHGNKTVAATLDISLWTVGTYLRRVFQKLQVGTRAEMAARLVELGLMSE